MPTRDGGTGDSSSFLTFPSPENHTGRRVTGNGSTKPLVQEIQGGPLVCILDTWTSRLEDLVSHEDISNKRTSDMVLMEQAPKFGNPPVLLSDMRPKEPPLLFILDAEVAEQITKPTKQYSTSVPKTPNMKNLSPLVGERSLVNLDVSFSTL